MKHTQSLSSLKFLFPVLDFHLLHSFLMRTSFNAFGAILFACALRAAVAQGDSTLTGDQGTCMTQCIGDTPIAPCAVGDIQCTSKILACGTDTCKIPSASATAYYNATCISSGFDPSKPPSKGQTGSADIRG
ncbi:hypothetical protein B0H13DRAFT_2005070, partial [Mycena leptocephala]